MWVSSCSKWKGGTAGYSSARSQKAASVNGKIIAEQSVFDRIIKLYDCHSCQDQAVHRSTKRVPQKIDSISTDAT